MKTIAGLFERFEDADQAVQRLLAAGFSRDKIGILAQDSAIARKMGQDPDVKEVAESAGAGIAAGGAGGGLVGLLVGLGALAIPGIGPVVAAGSLAATLGLTAGGAAVGAAVGGILGAMTKLGVSEAEAEAYAEGVKRGGILVTVQAEEPLDTVARDALIEAGAQDTNTLRERWKREGWTGFDKPPAR